MGADGRLPTFEQFFAYRRFQPTAVFTPDGGSVLFVSDISGQFNLWRVPVDGGWPQQLTAFEENSVRSVAVAPDGRTIAFIADHHGDEFHQIYSLPAEGGWPEQLTHEPQVQHFLDQDGWSPDGRRIAYGANARVPTDQDVWLRDMESGAVENVLGGGLLVFPGAWSRDGQRMLAVDVRSNTDLSVHLIELGAGENRELTPHDEEVFYVPGPWASDSSSFYLATNEGREYVGLAQRQVDDPTLDWMDAPEGDVEEIAASQDGRVLAYLVNDRGWSRLRVRDVESGKDLPDAQLPQGARSTLGAGLTVSSDGRRVAVIWQSPQRSPELYLVETETGEARRLSDSRLGGLAEHDLVAPELIAYPSFDGREIPAWIYRPPARDGRVPVVLSIHGGPEAQERPIYMPLYQYLLSRGIAVMATNIRGSSGYGKSYQKLIHRDWGGGDLKDWEHAAKWLHAQDWVDRDRIGVYGGSYGGFATLSCVTRLPDLWAAAVDIVGPSNLVTFAKAVPPTWKRFMKQWVGDPETEQDFLLERSPITYVDNVKAPLLVLQGATDPRVVKGESDQMVERLRELGRTVEYVVFDDEGHGFTKRSNQLRAFRLAADWLERHLAPETPLAVSPSGRAGSARASV